MINKRFLALSLLAGVGRLQNSMALLALVAASQASGFSVLESSLIGSALFFAAALSAIWKGKMIDRQGRSVIVRQAQILALVFAILLCAFLWAPWWVAVAGALLLGSVRFNPAALQQALWSEVHKDQSKLARAMAWENSVSFVAQIAGPLLSVLVIWSLGGYGALAIAGTLTVLSMGIWGRLAPGGAAKSPANKKFAISALRIVASLFLLSLAAGALQGILIQEPQGALLIALYTLGAAATGFYFFRRSFPHEWLLPALAVSPLLLFAPALAWGSVFLVPALLLGGALFSAGTLAANMKIKEGAPSDRLNEAFSLPLVVAPLGISTGVLLSGLLLSFSWQPIVIITSLVIALLVTFLNRKNFDKAPTFSTRQVQKVRS